MMGGVKSEAAPNPNQGPLTSSLQTAGSLQGGPIGQAMQGPLAQMFQRQTQPQMQSPPQQGAAMQTSPMTPPSLPQTPAQQQQPNPLMALFQRLGGMNGMG